MRGYWHAAGRTAWHAMGRWRWIWLTMILISIALTPIAGPSHSRWITAVPVDGSGSDAATLQTRASATQSIVDLRLSLQAESWRYRVGKGPWFDASGTTVHLSSPRHSDVLVVACSTGIDETCWRWQLDDIESNPIRD